MARECPNLHLIGSMVLHTSVLDDVKTLGADRVCLGSDPPFVLMHVFVAEYHALVDGEVTVQEKTQVMGGICFACWASRRDDARRGRDPG